MFTNPLILLGTSTLFASIPAGIWLYIFFSKKEKGRRVVALIFLLGCLTAPALLGIQYLWDIFPQFNLSALIEETLKAQSSMYIAMFILFGAMEEIIKMIVVIFVDRHTLLINRISDALRYSIAAALGFSFIENIYYLYQFWPMISAGELTGMYIFRSIFTTCAHLIFSGIFGYFYGISKFSIDIAKNETLTRTRSWITRAIARTFELPFSHAYQQHMILKGLFIAITLHAFYNYLLQFNIILPALILVIIGYLYLQYLLNRKAGHLILSTDISEKTSSTIAKKDEEVVIELLGLWFNEKRYVDVIHICERLLQRDPGNNVIKIFKAKALDKLDERSVYKKILSSIIKTGEDLSEQDHNIITRYTGEKEKALRTPQKAQENQKNPPTSLSTDTETYHLPQ